MADGRVERNTKQKELIHDALKSSDEFISAQDLHRKLEDEDVKVGLATVYRQLNALAEAGEADTVRLEGQQLFRLCGDDGHHHHLVCTNCGKTVETDHHPKHGYVASVQNMVLPSNGIRWKYSDSAPTARTRCVSNSSNRSENVLEWRNHTK